MPTVGEGTLQVLSFTRGQSASGRVQSYKRRKAHRKSQTGCVICKRRRVKCDEQAPACQNCVKYGTVEQCHYKTDSQDDGQAHLSQIGKSVEITVSTDWFPNVDSKLFEYFLTVVVRSMLPMPGRAMDASQKVVSIAIAEPHAMHSILAVAGCHWRYHQKTYRRKCPSEIFHSIKACSGLRHYLSAQQGVKIDVDTVMTTSMFLGSLSLACATEDLDVPLEERTVPFYWLENQLNFGSLLDYFHSRARLQNIWAGMFGAVAQDVLQLFDDSAGVGGIPDELATLFDVDESSTPEQHQYLSVLRRLCHILSLDSGNEFALLQYMQFVEGLSSPFVLLLNALDPRALMLLSYGLALLCSKDCWWSRVRARIDCWEVCRYLEKSGDKSLWKYMDFPAFACDYPYLSPVSTGRLLVDRLRLQNPRFVGLSPRSVNSRGISEDASLRIEGDM